MNDRTRICDRCHINETTSFLCTGCKTEVRAIRTAETREHWSRVSAQKTFDRERARYLMDYAIRAGA